MAAQTYIAISELHPNFSHPVSSGDYQPVTAVLLCFSSAAALKANQGLIAWVDFL